MCHLFALEKPSVAHTAGTPRAVSDPLKQECTPHGGRASPQNMLRTPERAMTHTNALLVMK